MLEFVISIIVRVMYPHTCYVSLKSYFVTVTLSRSTVNLGIRKIQYAPPKQGRQPCTIVRKDFMLSPGELELEATLDKQVNILYF